MITYIKRNTTLKYITFKEELNPKHYNVGSTYEDYLNNKWVLLSDKQVKFHEDNPNASIKEVFDMKLNVNESKISDLEIAKRELLRNIEIYNNSEDVNSFTINDSISGWITSTERTSYKTSIDAAKLLGVELLSFYINDTEFSIPTEKAELMLAATQLYADECFIITKRHLAAAEKLQTIEEISSYDYKVGYPKRLNFEL